MLKHKFEIVILLWAIWAGLPAIAQSPPNIMLWAWERPEALTYLDEKKAGVAFLAQRLAIKGSQVIVIPRTQKLALKDGTYLTAVFRIDTPVKATILLTSDLRNRTTETIVKYVLANRHKNPAIKEVQIDFDAKQSERGFYTELLKELREALPDDLKLSMTALASWCLGDYWLNDLPVDEIVPMLFSMGRDGKRIKFEIDRHKGFIGAKCQCAVGLSSESVLKHQFAEVLQNTEVSPNRKRRIYVFSPRAWTKELADQVIAQIEEGAKSSADKKE